MATNNEGQSAFAQANIALWGPTQAGKDWLIQGFIKEIEYYNDVDKNFYYELTKTVYGGQGQQTQPVFPTPPSNLPPSVKPDDIDYQFQRIRRPNTGRNRTPKTPQTHRIIIHNDAGINLVGCLDDDYLFRQAFLTLIEAKNIILVLGIPESGSSSKNNLSSFEKDIFEQSIDQSPSGSNWSVRDYNQFLRKLIYLLDTRPGRNIAVCLTKGDQENYHRSPEELLKLRFGESMLSQLNLYKDRHNIKIFATTAAGYIMQNGINVPNEQGGAIIDENRWHPRNTASPFFWIFEKIEYEQLASQNNIFRDNTRNFDKYPTQR